MRARGSRRELTHIRLMLRLARLHFLVPGLMLYTFGYLLAVLAGASNDVWRFLFGYAVFGCAHLSVSFSNDYFDRESDRNSVHTAFSGGSRVLVEHPELESLALEVAAFLLGVSATLALIFTVAYAYSYWFLIFALLGALLGWFYTAPPLKLAYRGLSEVSTMIAVGLVMPGMGYLVASGSMDSFFAVFIFPLSCYGLLFILTVEMPDVENDAATHKTNLLVKWGRRAGARASVVTAIAGTLSLAAIHLSGILEGKADIGTAILLSLILISGVAGGLLVDIDNREPFFRQLKINMSSMILFLLLTNASLLVQLVI